MISEVFNIDCLDFMRTLPDGFFDLAIVDPPYGIGVANMNMGLGKGKKCSKAKNRNWTKKDWDDHRPTAEYFEHLNRVSVNQIIWGGNYFSLPASQYFAVWDKGEGMTGRDFAEAEYAWVKSGGTRIFKFNPVQKDRIHPTQKPIALYRWLLQNYAKSGFKIFDSHMGSQSSRIAAHDMGFDYWGCELDPDYFRDGNARFAEHIKKAELFTPAQQYHLPEQPQLF